MSSYRRIRNTFRYIIGNLDGFDINEKIDESEFPDLEKYILHRLWEIDQIISEIAGIRRSGSAALDLAWVAAGRYDAYWEYGLSLWDIAAGIIIIREAGGVVTGLDGSENDLYTGNVIAGNDNIHESLLKKIKNIYLQDS